jgi:protein-L-isoaspartate O-methyltransferase
MTELIERLEAAGVPLDDLTKIAMEDVDPADFTDYDLEPFWNDRPVPFLFTDFGATRTISAPHMIATLLHHLEIIEGQDIMLIGSKGGFICDYRQNGGQRRFGDDNRTSRRGQRTYGGTTQCSPGFWTH